MACPNILVVTLFSGENEFDECIDSVRRQIGVVIVHEIIADLPKRLAHQRLFEMFNERRGESTIDMPLQPGSAPKTAKEKNSSEKAKASPSQAHT